MNWGTKIVLGMAAFMLFIITMVSYMFYVHGRDTLVDDDYYELGNNYDKEFNAARNTVTDHAKPDIKLTAKMVLIKLKDSCTYRLILKRVSNHNDDKSYKGLTIGKENLIIIKRDELPQGLWFLTLNWTVNNKEFLFKQNISL